MRCSAAATRCSRACPASARRCSCARSPRRSTLTFSRIQFTPDLMPADIVGTNVIVEDGGGKRFEFQTRPDLREHRARRRDQPRHAEDAVGAARGDEEKLGHRRQADLQAREAVLRARDAEPARDGRHLSAARGAARSLLLQAASSSIRRARRCTRSSTARPARRGAAAEKVADRRSGILEMRELVRKVPLARQIQDYAVRVVLATHPENPEATPMTKKFMRYGASPRGAAGGASSPRRSARCSRAATRSSIDDIRHVARAGAAPPPDPELRGRGRGRRARRDHRRDPEGDERG